MDHHSPRIFVMFLFSRLGYISFTRALWRLQNKKKAFIGFRVPLAEPEAVAVVGAVSIWDVVVFTIFPSMFFSYSEEEVAAAFKVVTASPVSLTLFVSCVVGSLGDRKTRLKRKTLLVLHSKVDFVVGRSRENTGS